MGEMINDLIIIGASGFGREVANVVEAINLHIPTWNLIGLIDDNLSGKTVEGFNIIGTVDDVINIKNKPYVAIAIADYKTRKRLVEKFETHGFKFATLIDPSARIGRRVEIGEGSIICMDTHFTTNIKIGDHCIINNSCGIGHDTILADYVSMMSNTIIGGDVFIGEGCYFGLSCSVINMININQYCKFGSGAIVVTDIPSNSLAVGVPAKVIKKLD